MNVRHHNALVAIALLDKMQPASAAEAQVGHPWTKPMLDQASRFVNEIPAHYDKGLGPYLFADYAADLAQRAAAARPRSVLEIAVGHSRRFEFVRFRALWT